MTDKPTGKFAGLIGKPIEELRKEIDRLSHPAARIFPMLVGKEWDEFLADIKGRGQLKPITLDADGRILDGRNRLLACLVLGIEPMTETLALTGAAAVAFVKSANVHRRHDDAGTRAMQIVKLDQMLVAAGEAPLTQAEKAELAGASDRYIRQSERLAEQAPEFAAEVAKGNVTLHAANTAAKITDTKERKNVLTSVQQAGNKKKAKKIVKAAKPLEMPKMQGAYSTLLAVLKALPDLAHNLRNIRELSPHGLASGGAKDIKDAVVKFRKRFDPKEILAGADAAEKMLDEIIAEGGLAGADNSPAKKKEPVTA